MARKMINTKESLEEACIMASNKMGLTKQQLMDYFWDNGLMGVYNLGKKHMYEYLEERDGSKKKKN